MIKSVEISSWKLASLAVVALAAGLIAFNLTHIMHVSHSHSLAKDHKVKEQDSFQQANLGKKLSAERTTTKIIQKKEDIDKTPPASSDTVKAMMTRTCGSPAIDGYSHVVPKCLEESLTAKWWVDYYAKGGKQEDLIVHIEKGADYDGLAVAWGLGNKKDSAEECAQQCLEHMPGKIDGPFKNLPCNAFSWCPDDVCFVPDAHHHTKGDCWIKFTEGPAYPEINMRGDLTPDFKVRHPNAPKACQWWGGVLLPPGVKPTNGTFGPRAKW